MVVRPSAVGTVSNLAFVTASEVDFVTTNNSATTATVVKLDTDLAIADTASSGPVLLQQPLTYTLVVTNRGPHTATLVNVTDTLPAAFVLEAIAASQGSCSNLGGVVSCGLGSLAAGASATITLAGRPVSLGPLTNSASVSADEIDSDLSNNTSAAPGLVQPAADLALRQSASSDPVPAGQNLTYTLFVTNAGPSVATGVTIADTLPTSAQFISATASQGSCSTASGPVICAIGMMSAGDAVTVTLVTMTTPPGAITNSALVTLDPTEPVPANNHTTAVTAVVPVADLSVIKSDVPDPVGIGQSLVYTLMVTNHGPN